MKSALVALGGNAIRKAGESGDFSVQMANTRVVAGILADLIERDYRIVVTHGNGPQVGDLLLQNEMAKGSVPSLPLDACVAESQGLIGYMLVQSMDNEFRTRGMDMHALCILTRTLVDESDPAFREGSKPVGEYYTERDSRRLRAERGWHMVKDTARGGYRRVVPSPPPLDIVESEQLKSFFHSSRNRNEIMVLSGGGGIPVVRDGAGFRGVEAVIDKDLAAQAVANALGVEHLIILTDVDAAYLDFGTEKQKAIRNASSSQMRQYMLEGQFAEGSMLPKAEAAATFVESGGESAVITSREKVFGAIEGSEGTTVRA